MNEEKLITYYNKFYEEKRLKTRHGQVEYQITFKYINEYLKSIKSPKIIDIGAGMGAYSIPLFESGYDITAVELIKHNLQKIKEKNKDIKAYQGNATNLKKFKDNEYDLVLLFGPMYHLITKEEKLQALKEAKRIVKPNGIIMIAYIMNEYAILTRGFKEKSILTEKNFYDENYHIISSNDSLYSFVRLEDINELNKEVDLKRIKIITPDGPANYMRETLNKLSDDEFKEFIKYIEIICERQDILGASAHLIDIVTK